MINIDIRYPSSKIADENARKYLIYLVEQLNFIHSTTDGKEETAPQEETDDYVISQWQSGTWHIRRWKSGTVELFGTHLINAITLTSKGSYYSATITDCMLPVSVDRVYSVQASAFTENGADVYATQAEVSKSTFKCNLCAHTSALNGIIIRIHIIGKKTGGNNGKI